MHSLAWEPWILPNRALTIGILREHRLVNSIISWLHRLLGGRVAKLALVLRLARGRAHGRGLLTILILHRLTHLALVVSELALALHLPRRWSHRWGLGMSNRWALGLSHRWWALRLIYGRLTYENNGGIVGIEHGELALELRALDVGAQRLLGVWSALLVPQQLKAVAPRF